MTVIEALLIASARLRDGGLENPAAEARVLLAHSIHVPQDRLILHMNDTLTRTDWDGLESNLDARLQRKPASQIVGRRLFWGRSFRVTPDVLDPRPETEILVAEALAQPFARVLDLGTGSGCILLTLLAERPEAQGCGVDLSAAALAVAAANRAEHGLDARASLSEGCWFGPAQGRFDLIVSNPPYIAENEMASLAPEVRDWEPRMALTPGGDGLDAYRAIAAGARDHLLPGGRILLEIGPTQGAAVTALLTAQGLTDLRILPDFDRRDRVVAAMAP
jgi:release factor glutamine methyltransferase